MNDPFWMISSYIQRDRIEKDLSRAPEKMTHTICNRNLNTIERISMTETDTSGYRQKQQRFMHEQYIYSGSQSNIMYAQVTVSQERYIALHKVGK